MTEGGQRNSGGKSMRWNALNANRATPVFFSALYRRVPYCKRGGKGASHYFYAHTQRHEAAPLRTSRMKFAMPTTSLRTV